MTRSGVHFVKSSIVRTHSRARSYIVINDEIDYLGDAFTLAVAK